MSNKRDLKKGINYICSRMFAEGLIILSSNEKTEDRKVDTLLESIINLHSDYIKRVSYPEPGLKMKDYYKILVCNFIKEANSTVDRINSLR